MGKPDRALWDSKEPSAGHGLSELAGMALFFALLATAVWLWRSIADFGGPFAPWSLLLGAAVVAVAILRHRTVRLSPQPLFVVALLRWLLAALFGMLLFCMYAMWVGHRMYSDSEISWRAYAIEHVAVQARNTLEQA